MNTTSANITAVQHAPSSSEAWCSRGGGQQRRSTAAAHHQQPINCQICSRFESAAAVRQHVPLSLTYESIRRCASCHLPACISCMPPDARYALEDGSVICQVCHYIRHSATGPEDLNRFGTFHLQQFAMGNNIAQQSMPASKSQLCMLIWDKRDALRRVAPTTCAIRQIIRRNFRPSRRECPPSAPYNPNSIQQYAARTIPSSAAAAAGFSYEIQHYQYQSVVSRPMATDQRHMEQTSLSDPNYYYQQQPHAPIYHHPHPHQQQQPTAPAISDASSSIVQAFSGLNQSINQAAATMSHLASDMECVFDTVNEAMNGVNANARLMQRSAAATTTPMGFPINPRLIQERRLFVEQKHTVTITRPTLPPQIPARAPPQNSTAIRYPTMARYVARLPQQVPSHHPSTTTTSNIQPQQTTQFMPPPQVSVSQHRPQPPPTMNLSSIRSHSDIDLLTPRQLVALLDEYLVPHDCNMSRLALANRVKRLFDEERRQHREASNQPDPPTATADDGDDEDDASCKICMAKRAEYAFIDCGHMVACLDCSKRLRICPICRSNITKIIRIFKS